MKTKILLLLFLGCSASLLAQQISRGSLNTGSTVHKGKIAVVENNVRLIVVEKTSAPLPSGDEKIILDNIYPNPASDHAVINVVTAEAGKIQFRFFSTSGALVSETSWKLIEKGGHAITLDVSNLSPQVYMVSAYFEDEHGNIKASSTSKLTKF